MKPISIEGKVAIPVGARRGKAQAIAIAAAAGAKAGAQIEG